MSVRGEELHRLLVENGFNFNCVEAQIEKFERTQAEEWLQGGWHTHVSLAQMGWTECLGSAARPIS